MKTRISATSRTYLHQLCCSGLDSKIIMPDIIKTLKKIIVHQSALFMWFDKPGETSDMYIDRLLPDVLNLYFTEYQNFINPYGPDLCIIARIGKSTGNYRQVPKEFYKTDMFNLICQPHGHHFMLDGIVREDNRSIGGIMLTREKGQQPFSREEENVLHAILPFLGHALKNQEGFTSCEANDDYPSGSIVATRHGDISHISPEAREILFWAYHSSMRLGAGLMDIMDILPGHVRQLCSKLDDVSTGKRHLPPLLKIPGRFGPVTLRAYRLNSMHDGCDDMVGINVIQQRPTELIVMRRLHDMPLSPRQKEVAWRIARGESSRVISDKMKISPTTYRDHVCKLYEKLNIRSREELLRKLVYRTEPPIQPQ